MLLGSITLFQGHAQGMLCMPNQDGFKNTKPKVERSTI